MREVNKLSKLKVLSIDSEFILFEHGVKMYSEHAQSCCEDHYLCFHDLTMSDFDGLTFDLSNDNFFKGIDGYGIELIPNMGHSVKIPGYGSNNGYYSDNLTLVITIDNESYKEFDVSEFQVIHG